MRIYIKTPLVNKSKMIPHLVEHCIWHSFLSLDDFFDFSYWVDWVITTDYTYFEFDKRINYKDVIKKLTEEIDKESFLYEKKIIKQELENVNYDQRIYEWVVRRFIDCNFSVNNFEKVLREEVKSYHEKYYIPENMIVVDESDYKILKQWFKANKESDYTQIIKKHSFTFEDDKYLVYIWNKTDWTLYWQMYFFFRLLCFFWAYTQRWQDWEYYYLEPYFYEYDSSCIVMIWDYDYSQLGEKFFEWWKQYIINMFEAWYFKEKFFLNEYFYWIPKTRKEAIQIINNFSREEFQKLLKLK